MTHTCIILTCRFVCANLAGKCRWTVILEHFGKDATAATCEGVFCDVCDTQPEMANAQNEISLVLKTVRDLPGYGEVKVSANISDRNTLITFLFILALHLDCWSSARVEDSFQSSTCQQPIWRGHINRFVPWYLESSHLSGLDSGVARARNETWKRAQSFRSDDIQLLYTLWSRHAFLKGPHTLILPVLDSKSGRTIVPAKPEEDEKPRRKGKGCHAIEGIRSLLSSHEKWFTITTKEDYQFPGIFRSPYPQRLGYCPDISTRVPAKTFCLRISCLAREKHATLRRQQWWWTDKKNRSITALSHVLE